MKDRVLNALKDAGGYLSGEQLGQELGISRTAVWKAVSRLKKEGYQIEAVTNKGYRLVSAQGEDILNQTELERALTTVWAGRPCIYKSETGSTNEDILRLSDQGYPQGTLVVAGSQTRGKGRRGRTWISPPDCNVYMSILLRPEKRPGDVPSVTLVMALSVYAALKDLAAIEGAGDVRFGIKWPNDIVAWIPSWGSFRKVAGILTEMRLEETRIRDVVIGTGLNINRPEGEDALPAELAESAAWISDALGQRLYRARLTAAVWKHFEEDYAKFEQGGLSLLKEAYEEGLVNIGRKVRVLDPRGEYTGEARGITDAGELLVLPDGEEKEVPVSAGEISVRGVMGYV